MAKKARTAKQQAASRANLVKARAAAARNRSAFKKAGYVAYRGKAVERNLLRGRPVKPRRGRRKVSNG